MWSCSFGSTLKCLKAGLFSAFLAGEEGRQNIEKNYATYLKAIVKFTNDIKLNYFFFNDFVLYLHVFVDTLFYSRLPRIYLFHLITHGSLCMFGERP